MPALQLIWIKPDICKSGDVFRKPYKKRGQKKSEQKRHMPMVTSYPKINLCFTKEKHQNRKN